MNSTAQANLAYRMRPERLDEFVGQEHLVGKGKIIRTMIKQDRLFSMIFWGPPGSGKTTLAVIISKETNSDFHQISAVTAGKRDLLEIIEIARQNTQSRRQNAKPSQTSPHAVRVATRTILFIDEIHRWNKAQQDALLPHVESGLITLIGATTQNPSFEIIGPLLSRCRVFVLEPLGKKQLHAILDTALHDKQKGLGTYQKKLREPEKNLLIRFSGGDARILLNGAEIAFTAYKEQIITKEIIEDIFQQRLANLYDKAGEQHYNTISAFIKSMRAGQPDAALYYLARMVDAGEDPKFIARRMVIFASEDIGMAQPTALVVANEVFRAVETIGYPECAINLAHGVVYLTAAKKDRSAYDGLQRALHAVKEHGNVPIPLKIRNAPTKLMQELGYGKGYDKYTDKDLLPNKLKGLKFYS